MSAATLRAYGAAERDAPTHGYVRVVRELRRCHVKFGKVTPSVEGIAARTGLGTATVKRATRWFRDRGWLTVVTRRAHCRGDGTWHRSQTNLYVLHWPTAAARRAWSHRGIIGDPSTASGTVGAPCGVAPTDVVMTNAPPPPPPPAPPDPGAGPEPAPAGPNVPTVPPWIREGITRDEWIRRQRTAGT